jgi:hypothetical protein
MLTVTCSVYVSFRSSLADAHGSIVFVPLFAGRLDVHVSSAADHAEG